MGSIVAGALLYSSPSGQAMSLSYFSESQVFDRSEIGHDIESRLIEAGIVFVETGNAEFMSAFEYEVFPGFPSKFPMKTSENKVTKFYSIYLVKDGDYNNSINIRTMVADEEFDSFNRTVIMDFICDGMTPRYAMENDYCIVKDF